MSRPLCSVVLCSYNRAHLLKRSLICYENQTFPKEEFEIVIVDDHSEDDTARIVYEWSARTGIKSLVITPHPKPVAWRDCGAILNIGIRAASGHHILLTHPEVMVGFNSVKECVGILAANEELILTESNPHYPPEYKTGINHVYVCCKPYYLSPRDQERLPLVDWARMGPLAVRGIEGFYDLEQHVNGNPDYQPLAIESVGKPGYRHSHWLSWVFGGCSRRTWKMMGGMLCTVKWGAVDVAFMQRRRTLGIQNVTLMDDDTLVIHQCHDDPTINTPTPRIEADWKKELESLPLSDMEAMRFPQHDELGWG